MKKFEDLIFEDHEHIAGGKQSTLWFDNGYGVSVLFGERFECGFYSNGVDTYELAVINEDGLTYPLEDDVIGFLKADEVTAYMEKVQDLPPSNNTMGDMKFTTAGDMMKYVYPGSDVQQ